MFKLHRMQFEEFEWRLFDQELQPWNIVRLSPLTLSSKSDGGKVRPLT